MHGTEHYHTVIRDTYFSNSRKCIEKNIVLTYFLTDGKIIAKYKSLQSLGKFPGRHKVNFSSATNDLDHVKVRFLRFSRRQFIMDTEFYDDVWPSCGRVTKKRRNLFNFNRSGSVFYLVFLVRYWFWSACSKHLQKSQAIEPESYVTVSAVGFEV